MQSTTGTKGRGGELIKCFFFYILESVCLQICLPLELVWELPSRSCLQLFKDEGGGTEEERQTHVGLGSELQAPAPGMGEWALMSTWV